MKKSILAWILALALILALAACNTSTTDSGSQGTGGASTPVDTGSAAGGADAETPASDGKNNELSFASMFPAGSPYDTKITAYIDEQLREKSGGRLGLQVYAGESLVATANVIDAVSSGMADMGIMYLAAAPGRFPVSQLFELPNYYASGAATTHAYMDFYNEFSEAFTEFDGVKVLALYASGPGALVSQE
jgi:TRAP-type C4-dicarboxylate transport system substrate-binding protein